LIMLWPFAFVPYIECKVNKFLFAQLLPHFSNYFDKTFTEALSSNALRHIVGVLWFDNFWLYNGPLLFFFIWNINWTLILTLSLPFAFFLIWNIVIVNNVFYAKSFSEMFLLKPGFITLRCFLLYFCCAGPYICTVNVILFSASSCLSHIVKMALLRLLAETFFCRFRLDRI
jgi:hypothetical protein